MKLKNSLYFLLALFLSSCSSSKEFNLRKVASTHPNDPQWEIPFDPTAEDEVKTLLNQHFYYIGRGNHCLAFESEDKRCVLKFFRQSHLGRHTWKNFLPVSHALIPSYKNRYDVHLKRREKDFMAYKLSHLNLRNETGIFYLHLNKNTHLGTKVTLHYKNKIIKDVALDKMEFLLQKRVDVGFKKLEQLMAEGNIEEVFKLCRSVLELVKSRAEKGYSNRDIQFYKNYGFSEDRAYVIDCNYLKEETAPLSPEETKKDIDTLAEGIENWFGDHHKPYLGQFFKVVEDVKESVDRASELRGTTEPCGNSAISQGASL